MTGHCIHPRCRALAVVLYSVPTAPQGWRGPLCFAHYDELCDWIDERSDRRYRITRWAAALLHRWERLPC